MKDKEIIKEYPKGDDFTVVWKPGKCIHSEICVKTLPEVYHPGKKPWIRTENASIKALKDQIDRCPSGALTYKESLSEEEGSSADSEALASLIPGGPLMIKGSITLENDGETRILEGPTAFCRCGASSNKPFCDGSHRKVGFTG